jgi:hypothetical protein
MALDNAVLILFLTLPSPMKSKNNLCGYCTTSVSVISFFTSQTISLSLSLSLCAICKWILLHHRIVNLISEQVDWECYGLKETIENEGFASFYFHRQSIYKRRPPLLYTPAAPILWQCLASSRRHPAFVTAAKNITVQLCSVSMQGMMSSINLLW